MKSCPEIIFLHRLKGFANNKACEPFSVKHIEQMKRKLEGIDFTKPIKYIKVKHCLVLDGLDKGRG